VLVAINMSAAPQKVAFDLRARGFGAKAKTLLSTDAASGNVKLSDVSLGPYGVFIGEVK